jgi:hypothetical protein
MPRCPAAILIRFSFLPLLMTHASQTRDLSGVMPAAHARMERELEMGTQFAAAASAARTVRAIPRELRYRYRVRACNRLIFFAFVPSRFQSTVNMCASPAVGPCPRRIRVPSQRWRRFLRQAAVPPSSRPTKNYQGKELPMQRTERDSVDQHLTNYGSKKSRIRQSTTTATTTANQMRWTYCARAAFICHSHQVAAYAAPCPT